MVLMVSCEALLIALFLEIRRTTKHASPHRTSLCPSGSQPPQRGAEQQAGAEQGAAEQEERPGDGDGSTHRRPEGTPSQEASRSARLNSASFAFHSLGFEVLKV